MARRVEQAGSALRQRAEHLAATLPPLLVAAERVASTVAQGVHGRRRVGSGETFWQFRRYQTGDSSSAIDWRQSAKSQHVFIRENEWEAAESVWLWCDGSPSMDFVSRFSEVEKADRAVLLTLATAALLVRGGERIALLGVDSLPRSGRAALGRLADALLDASGRPRKRDTDSLPEAERLPRYAQIVLIGDFLSPIADFEAGVRAFSGRGQKGHMVEDLPFEGRTAFGGLEGEGSLVLGRADRAREAFGARMVTRRAALKDLARQARWTYALHRTDRSPESALLVLYAALAGNLG